MTAAVAVAVVAAVSEIMVVAVATIVFVVVGACISSRGVLFAGCWHAGGWHLGLLDCLHRLLACLAGLQPCWLAALLSRVQNR